MLVLDRSITDQDEYTKFASAIQCRVECGLADAGILGDVRRVAGGVVVERDGFIIDTGALFDRARLYFAPNAAVEGEPAPRRAEILVLGGVMTFSVDDLLDEVPAPPSSTSRTTSSGSNTTQHEDGPLTSVLAAFAALPGARVYADGRVSQRCIFHDDKHPSAVIFGHGMYHCSVCLPKPLSFRALVTTPEARAALGDDVVDTAIAARRDVHVRLRPREPRWPTPLGPAAYHGVLGRLVRIAEPHTESDAAAILFQALVAVGNLLGRKVFIRVERTRHFLVLFLVLVGATSKGRKGASWDLVLDFFPLLRRDMERASHSRGPIKRRRAHLGRA